MAVVTQPYSADEIDPSAPPVYAPLTLSGLVIGMNIERIDFDRSGTVQEPAETQIKGTRITNVNLTPRLVAKLLTESYSRSFLSTGPRPADYDWLNNNPQTIVFDEDFLRFNPEFRIISVGSPRTMTAVTVEFSTSDSAAAVWRWILADPEAKAWLDGAPDAWGMKVNPNYATTASANRNGAPFGDPLPNSFPKNDPYCFQNPPEGTVTPRPLCLSDFNPYVNSMVLAASAARNANDGSATVHDDAVTHQSSSTWWSAEGPEPLGTRSFLSITDSASAARFGLQTARLSQAGMAAAQRSMITSAEDPTVLVNDPTKQQAGAYPLTLLTYAAAFPSALDQASRDDYARFIEYAVGAGQTPGVDFGDLPPGYAPLSSSLVTAAQKAATELRNGTPPAPTPPTTTPSTSVAPTITTVPATTPTTEASGVPPPGSFPGGGGSSDQSASPSFPRFTPGNPSSPSSSQSALSGATPPDSSGATDAAAPASDGATTPAAGGAKSTTPPKRGITAAIVNTATGRYALPVLFGTALLASAGVLILDPKLTRSLKSRLRPKARR
jgi:hypothetical protein